MIIFSRFGGSILPSKSSSIGSSSKIKRRMISIKDIISAASKIYFGEKPKLENMTFVNEEQGTKNIMTVKMRPPFVVPNTFTHAEGNMEKEAPFVV